ncbi:hypothetical protein [Nostoc sp. CMAA1605]|uniref:hypothetical protein n=1 Tax=Nostoc sp. CMAA1605 TaxID=2055159 RepID=UPI001F16975F|nr:hypothetical protein [Nostoc sp. CMAA1605]MCF4966856.1 hypothetical protein [Nostoc sp. CMAA1605]
MQFKKIFLSCLAIIVVTICSPVLANSDRYPTSTEVESTRGELRNQIHTASPDVRTLKEKRARQLLVSHWLKYDQETAQFLGNWSAFESSMAVYPAKTRNRVCLVYIGLGQVDFELGRVVDGKLRNARKNLLLLEGNYMGVGSISEGRVSMYLIYHSPRALASINKVVSEATESSNAQKAKLIRDFKKYGCINP